MPVLHKVGSEVTLDKNMTTTIKYKGRSPSGRNHAVTLSVRQQKG